MDLTQDDLKKIVSYDPDTGLFTWLVANGRRVDQIGQPAGNVSEAGYLRICIRRRSYQAHRLAWFYVHGSWPAASIDHINRNRLDNRIANLREATASQNGANTPVRTPSGLKGAYWHEPGKSWMASITIGGKRKYLGLHRTAEAAHAAYMAAALEAFGDFARN